jgi:aromatic-L-amino-acid decarboxylase
MTEFAGEEFNYPADTLGLEPDEMRRLGYQVVDLVIDRLAHKHGEAALTSATAEELTRLLGGPLPEQPLDADASLALLAQVALPCQQRGDHPRYFARVPGPSSFAAILGDWLATGFNSIAASWAGGAGPATLELVVTQWICQLMGFPASSEGVLLSGGSHANLTALLVARSELGPGVVYLSDQTHASLLRNLKALGLTEQHIRVLPSDEQQRIDLSTLTAAISSDRAQGLQPRAVIATAGTTNTGSIDPLPEIAQLCQREAMWFHIDGAYGAPAVLTEQGQRQLEGMALADSLVIDPHKWFFQPYDAGCLLVRHPGALERCFAMNPEYLKDVQSDSCEVDFRNRSLELTRRSRATKLWLSMRTYGIERFRLAIAQGMAAAEYAESYLRCTPERWDVVSPAQLGIVCFALRGANAAEHERRAQRLTDSGLACVSTTVLQGSSVLRLCTINPLTTEQDIAATLDHLAE